MKNSLLKISAIAALVLNLVTPAFGQDTKSMAELEAFARSVTVRIIACPTPRGGKCSVGTGFVVRAGEYDSTIVTNKHVCQGAELTTRLKKKEFGILDYNIVRLERTDSEDVMLGQIVNVASNVDLCTINTRMLFKNEAKPTRRSLAPAEIIVSFGYSNATPTWVKGEYVERQLLGVSIHDQTSLEIYGGHSGSPVFDIHGEVVGVIDSNAIDTRTGKAVSSWMVPAQQLLDFLGEK